MRKIIISLCMLIMVFTLFACGSTEEEKEKNIDTFDIDYTVVQQEMSNYVCEAPYFIHDGWIYTMSFPEDGGLGILAKLRIDGSEYSVLTEQGAPYFITVDGEFVYAIIVTETSSKAYRCRLGGDDLTALTSDDVWYLQADDDYLYYNKQNFSTGETTGFYRCNKDGTNEELILDKEIYYSYIIGSDLYYQDDNDGEIIKRYNMSTKEEETITTGLSYSFVIDGDNGYYIKNDNSVLSNDYIGDLIKINLETKEETVLYEGVDTGGISVTDNRIYFTNSNDENRIYSIEKNGEGIRLITQDTNCTRLAMFGEHLLYTKFDSNKEYIEGVFICNGDGSSKIQISK